MAKVCSQEICQENLRTVSLSEKENINAKILALVSNFQICLFSDKSIVVMQVPTKNSKKFAGP
jgi:hypothetical protein